VLLTSGLCGVHTPTLLYCRLGGALAQMRALFVQTHEAWVLAAVAADKVHVTERGAIEWHMKGGEVQYSYAGKPISPWHDIPFSFGDAPGSHPGSPTQYLTFICEIPLGTREKFEIHKGVPHNSLLQDRHKDGSLREYVYSPSIVNYGAISQTWEDPNKPDEDTGLGGDNDPIDVLQLNKRSCQRGEVQMVRVLGALALVDDGETDWKLLVIDVHDPDTPDWKDVSDIPVERVNEVREWFRMYKTAEGKPENKFGLDERAVDAKHALRVAQVTHSHWSMLSHPKVKCTFEKKPCWLEEEDKDEL